MINFDDLVKENIKEHWSQIPDHPYRILIIEGSGSGKKQIDYSVEKVSNQILI